MNGDFGHFDATTLRSIDQRLNAEMAKSHKIGSLTVLPCVAGNAVAIAIIAAWTPLLTIWVLGASALTVGHGFVYRLPIDHPNWRRVSAAVQFYAGVVWGAMLAMVGSDRPVAQSLLLAALLGLMAQSVPFASAVRASAFAFLAGATISGTIALVASAEGLTLLGIGLLIVFAGFFGSLADLLNKRAVTTESLTVELARRAETDPLTGLLNRRAFDRLLRSILADEVSAIVAYLDLDGFKAVNDTFGHDVGDQLLVAVSERLRRAVPIGASVARIGGDEFVVVCPQGAAAEVGSSVLSAFAEPFALSAAVTTVGASVGIARHEKDGADTSVRELMRRADIAQLNAKRGGGSRVEFALSS